MSPVDLLGGRWPSQDGALLGSRVRGARGGLAESEGGDRDLKRLFPRAQPPAPLELALSKIRKGGRAFCVCFKFRNADALHTNSLRYGSAECRESKHQDARRAMVSRDPVKRAMIAFVISLP